MPRTTCDVLHPDGLGSCHLAKGHPGTHVTWDRLTASDASWADTPTPRPLTADVEWLIQRHPMQYGFHPDREPGDNYVNTEQNDDPAITERYNRCPECEQWSPCDVRLLVATVEQLQAENEALRAKLEQAVFGPPAEMSWRGRLVPISSFGMRTVIDEVAAELARLTTERDELAAANERIGLAYIEATNPGIDMDMVRRAREVRPYRPGACTPDGPADPLPCGEVCATCPIPAPVVVRGPEADRDRLVAEALPAAGHRGVLFVPDELGG